MCVHVYGIALTLWCWPLHHTQWPTQVAPDDRWRGRWLWNWKYLELAGEGRREEGRGEGEGRGEEGREGRIGVLKWTTHPCQYANMTETRKEFQLWIIRSCGLLYVCTYVYDVVGYTALWYQLEGGWNSCGRFDHDDLVFFRAKLFVHLRVGTRELCILHASGSWESPS